VNNYFTSAKKLILGMSAFLKKERISLPGIESL